MTTASPKNNHGNASGNGNRILNPTLNWKSNSKAEVDMKGWFLRGAAVDAGIAASVVTVVLFKTWWRGKDEGKKEGEEREDEERDVLHWCCHVTALR
jgi:hypothetical protein